AWDRVAQTDPARVTPTVKRQTLRQLTAARRHLKDAVGAAADDRQKQMAQAYLALGHAYAIHLDPADEPEAAKELLGKLRGVAASLKSHEEKGAELERLAAGEALVAARIAEGFLAIRFR